ncbi:MAG TPA: cupin domain-containing protein [Rhizomicrobium sp.]|nr:cupin domain-containing protein [Rhizomicrobium sp.]
MRPSFLKNWREGPFAVGRLKALHVRLAPGGRSHLPSPDEEEFAFVLEGTPDLWVDGSLYRLGEGDGVAMPARTAVSQCLINNTDREVRLFVLGEGARVGSRPSLAEPGPTAKRKRGRPDRVVHWREILNRKAARYPDSDEDQGIAASFAKRARLSTIGIHAVLLKPGRRTSYPHAERDEDEFAYVVSGRVEAWTDGHIAPMREGDFIGWEAGTGVTHVILNNSDADALLLIGGEASKARNQYWYPYHPSRNKAAGANYWADHPMPKLGPHDGLPDALRAKLPKRAQRDARTANKAALRTRR